MITGIDTSLSQDYISKYDAGEPKTIWKIGVLSAHAFAYVGQKMSDQTKSLDGLIEVVRFGLLGFENFTNAAGQPIAYKTTHKDVGNRGYNLVADEVISLMPSSIVIELGAKILEISTLSEQIIKNS